MHGYHLAFYMKQNNCGSPAESIIFLAHRFETIANKYVFQPMGLSAISMKILKLLRVHGQLTASDLIVMANSTKSNISQRLNFLEKEKYIIRTHDIDDGDKRKIRIELTAHGKQMISDLEKRFKKAQISFEEKFSAKELAEHRSFLAKINLILDSEEKELEKFFKN